MGAFVISKRFNGDYKFVFTSRKGKTIFTSLGYGSKLLCESMIDLVKANLESSTYVKSRASNGKYYFRLIVGGQVLATSRKYTTELRLQKGINEIVLYAAKAETLDFSESDFVFAD